MDEIKKIVSRIKNISHEKEYVIVAIDGRCASGKTTLANQIESELSATVLHMDDFFLQPYQRTEERLKEPGGNVDYERFLEEVMKPLKEHRAFSYRAYDCHANAYKNPVIINPNKITIVEGSYSCHPILWDYYDLHIYLSSTREEQIKRIKRRNGEEMLATFIRKWIPFEEQYFRAFDIKNRCEIKYRKG